MSNRTSVPGHVQSTQREEKAKTKKKNDQERANHQKERAKTHKREKGSKRKSKDLEKSIRVPKRKSNGQEKRITLYDAHVLAHLLTHDGHLEDEPITLGLTI